MKTNGNKKCAFYLPQATYNRGTAMAAIAGYKGGRGVETPDTGNKSAYVRAIFEASRHQTEEVTMTLGNPYPGEMDEQDAAALERVTEAVFGGDTEFIIPGREVGELTINIEYDWRSGFFVYAVDGLGNERGEYRGLTLVGLPDWVEGLGWGFAGVR